MSSSAKAPHVFTPWPKHPDGTPKKMGEMTQAEQRAQWVDACARLKVEFETPAIQAALAAALGEQVKS